MAAASPVLELCGHRSTSPFQRCTQVTARHHAPDPSENPPSTRLPSSKHQSRSDTPPDFDLPRARPTSLRLTKPVPSLKRGPCRKSVLARLTVAEPGKANHSSGGPVPECVTASASSNWHNGARGQLGNCRPGEAPTRYFSASRVHETHQTTRSFLKILHLPSQSHTNPSGPARAECVPGTDRHALTGQQIV